jgi:hypothetical protein
MTEPAIQKQVSRQINLLEFVGLIAAIAVGFAYHRAFGRFDFEGVPSAPSYWPWVRWASFLFAPAVVAAPALAGVDWVVSTRQIRSRRFSFFGWIWLANALCWLLVPVPFFGFFIALLLAMAQPIVTVFFAILFAFAIAMPDLRRGLTWIDWLALFSLVVFGLNAMLLHELLGRI